MKIVELKQKDLDEFLAKQKHSEFLQSFSWSDFQKKYNEVLRLGVEKEGELLAVASLIKKKLFFGKKYYYCPRGPVFDEFRILNFEFRMEEVENFLFLEIEKIAKENNAIFLRFEPVFEIRSASWRTKIIKTINLQPKKTLMMNLSIPEEEALKMMHQKTRYNIRLAKKKGVEIVKGGESDFNHFWKLMNKTSERDDFRIHSRDYYQNILKINFVELYFAKYNNKYITAGLFSFFGDTATYMHGASDNKYRNVMAPYALQWEVARKAKDSNYKYYDFYGVDEKKWPGVTRFKKGFGGFEKKYTGTFDMVFNGLWYNGYNILRKVRRRMN